MDQDHNPLAAAASVGPIHSLTLGDHDDTKKDGVVGGRYSLVEQMINKKDFEKYRNDIKKIKDIISDMQKYVTQHQLSIKKDLVTEKQLKIEREMIENDYLDRLKRT